MSKENPPRSAQGTIGRFIRSVRRAIAGTGEAERRLKAFEAATFEGIFESEGGRITDCNDQFAKMMGYERRDLVGVEIVDLVHPDDQDRARLSIDEKRRSVSPYAGVRKDGTVIHVEAHGRPDPENPRRRLTTVRDVTGRRRAEIELQRSIAFSAALVRIGDAIHASLDPRKVIAQVVDEGKEAMGSGSAAITMREKDGWRVQAVRGMPESVVGLLLSDADEKHTLIAEKTGHVLSIPDAFNDERCNADHMRRHGIRAVLAVPLLSEGSCVGMLYFNHHKEPHVFDEAEITFARQLGATASIALANARLFEERVMAETRLNDSTDRYAILFDTTSDGVWIHDLEGVILEVNDAYCRMSGYPRGELEGASISRVEAMKSPGEIKDHINRLLAARGGERFASRHRRKDGSLFDVDITAVYLEREGGRIAIFVRDVTDQARARAALEESVADKTAELVQSDRRYGDLVENVADIILEMDPRGEIRFASRAVERVLGYSPEEVRGMQLAGYVHPEDRDRALEAMRTADAGRQHVAEIRVRRRDGSWCWMSMLARSVSTGEPGGGEVRLVGTLSDVDELHRAQEQLIQSRQLEAVGRLAGGVAHDFNNILTVIIAGTDFAIEGLKRNDRARKDMQDVRAAADRAATLTKQLLAFSRRQRLEPEVLDVNKAILGIEGMLRRLLGEHIQVELDLGDRIGLVEVDPGQLDQVIMNLAVNARDAMLLGGTLTIETAVFGAGPNGEPGHWVKLSVIDTGVGMDAETLEHIFEPFFTTKAKGKGTGLGLATVYGVVKQSGGDIRVRSTPGKGSTFEVWLRRVEAAPLILTPKAATAVGGRGERVLVVEDEDGVRSLTTRILEKAGYKVTHASGGREALALFRACRGEVDLLLTDVVMPGMSGPVLAAKLASLRPSMGILFMSGYTDEAVLQHGGLEPGARLLHKPLTVATLTSEVASVLGAR